jgi:hypothetical protein
LLLDAARRADVPAQLFGKRHFERPLEWANPNVAKLDERSFSAIRLEPSLASERAAPAAAPTSSEACESSNRPSPSCGRAPHLPVRSAKRTQLRVDALTDALGLARRRTELACDVGRCDRNAPPFREVFAALADAEHWLLITQEAADGFARGDGRAFDDVRACLAARLTRLLEALRVAGQPDVEGVRELWLHDAQENDATCSHADRFPPAAQPQASETPMPK